MKKIDLLDERFARLYEEIKGCLDDEKQVFVFEHTIGEWKHAIHTRTAIISWDAEQFLVIQSHYSLEEESAPMIIRLPYTAVKFMYAELLSKSIYANEFFVGPEGHRVKS